MMAYDALHGVVLVLGGIGLNALTDAWVWDGNNWTAAPNLPTTIQYGAATFDEARTTIDVFGGNTGFSLVRGLLRFTFAS